MPLSNVTLNSAFIIIVVFYLMPFVLTIKKNYKENIGKNLHLDLVNPSYTWIIYLFGMVWLDGFVIGNFEWMNIIVLIKQSINSTVSVGV